jgi:hypothetical protein
MSIDEILGISPKVRYVAVYRRGKLDSRERAGLDNASASESDRYEELIVNPTLLKLVQQRGDIDCGGARWLLIRYGNFLQFVRAVEGGHVSVGLELDSDPIALAAEIGRVLEAEGESER